MSAAYRAAQNGDADEGGEEEVQEGDFEEIQEKYENKVNFNQSKKQPAKKHDYTKLFPGVFPSEKAAPTPTIAKLRGDDVEIMRRLITKYDDDVDGMFRDIKTNYMQWSKGEIKKKLHSYSVHHQQ